MIFPVCNGNFTQYQRTNAQGGLEQKDVKTVEACEYRCNGNDLSPGMQCYAFDFTSKNRCYIFTMPDYKLNPIGQYPDVTHYRRSSSNCSPGEVSGPGIDSRTSKTLSLINC